MVSSAPVLTLEPHNRDYIGYPNLPVTNGALQVHMLVACHSHLHGSIPAHNRAHNAHPPHLLPPGQHHLALPQAVEVQGKAGCLNLTRGIQQHLGQGAMQQANTDLRKGDHYHCFLGCRSRFMQRIHISHYRWNLSQMHESSTWHGERCEQLQSIRPVCGSHILCLLYCTG